jgi:hypothetical protein
VSTKTVALVAVLSVGTALYLWRSIQPSSPDGGHPAVPADDSRGVASVEDRPTERSTSAAPEGGLAASEPDARAQTQSDEPRSVPEDEDLGALVAGIDPSLRDRNVIVPSGGSKPDGPGLEDLELRFRAEHVDPSWSDAMEARILDQLSHVTGLGLVAFDARCRATICRVKLFYPPGTSALSSLDELKPVAMQIGFDHVLEVATIGEDGVPVAVLYFQRDAV